MAKCDIERGEILFRIGDKLLDDTILAGIESNADNKSLITINQKPITEYSTVSHIELSMLYNFKNGWKLPTPEEAKTVLLNSEKGLLKGIFAKASNGILTSKVESRNGTGSYDVTVVGRNEDGEIWEKTVDQKSQHGLCAIRKVSI